MLELCNLIIEFGPIKFKYVEKFTFGLYAVSLIAIFVTVSLQELISNLKNVLPGFTDVSGFILYLHSAKKPSAPWLPLVPAEAEVPELPLVPEVPLDPSVPVVPAVPLEPDVPDVPLEAEVTDETSVPEVHDEPFVPEVPSPPAAPARFTSQTAYVPDPLNESIVNTIAPVAGL